MLTTVALLAFANMALAQSDGLSLGDARLTYGILGPVRTDTKLLPGDTLFVAFDIKGVLIDKDNRVHYSTTTEICDGSGKSCFKQPGREQTVLNALGGNSFPAFARVDLGTDQPAGEYHLKVTVTDSSSKQSKTLDVPFAVKPRGFGVVGFTITGDSEGQVPVGLMSVGESAWINAAAVGFERDKSTGQPHVDLEMRITDEKGKPTLAKPFAGTINKDVHARANALPLQFLLYLNRAGKFNLDVKATDKVSGKTFSQSFPITVLPHK